MSKDENFTDASVTKIYKTKTSSLVVPDPQVANTYYWHVRGSLLGGVFSQWSDTRTYQIGGLAKPQLVSPASSAGTDVEDVVLDWAPVLGAKSYDLQVSTDINFNTLETASSPTGVTGTRYSPPVTLGNDQYYWRVRPVDANSNTLDWNSVDTWTFRRHWPSQPDLEYPTGGVTVQGAMYFQWTAVPHASSYTLQLSSTQAFNPGDIYDSCTTVNTTFIPTTRDDCFPQAGASYWWRIIAVDGTKNVVTDGILAEQGRFSYDPVTVTQLAPANGDSVEVPVLSWSPVAGAESYRVTLTAITGGASGAGVFDTVSTSYTPRTKLTVGATYRWTVQTVTNQRLGTILVAAAQPQFTVLAPSDTPGLTPEPTSPANLSQTVRFPTLRWTRVTNATSYKVLVRAVGTPTYVYLPDTFAYPAGEDDLATFLSPGDYEWIVEAFNGAVSIGLSSVSRTFRITDLVPVTGQRLALRGSALAVNANSCLAALPARCEDLRQTPVVQWETQPNAGYYQVFLSRDEQMTEIVTGYPKRVDTNRFIPPVALIDSQAGDAFYWFIQPCKASGKCAPLAHAGHAFNKLSNPVELLTPLPGPVANEVTFTWRDYLETNLDTEAWRIDATGVNPRVEARNYRIQVSTDPNFQTRLEGDNVVVDQTTYTSYLNTYPEGPLYWRVQALDGSGNALTWSPTGTFSKVSPSPTLVSPVNDEVINATEPLEWQPLTYAASYDVEVYKDGDTTGSIGNRVANGNVKQTAFTLVTPLPSATSSYTWRVRRVDAKGRPGPWSDLANPTSRFRVSGTAPSLVAPAAGGYVPANDALFTWTAVDLAPSYVFQRRVAGSSSVTESVTTPSLAWAPTSKLGDGAWEWRVQALDAANKVTGTSGWRTFRVDGTSPTVVSKSPITTAYRTANFKAKFSEPVKGVSSSTMRIYRSGYATPLLATVTLSADKLTATLNPSANLRVGVYYVVKLSSGITDLAGNKLVATSWKVRAK